MVGNDVVDLSDREVAEGPGQSRFDQRVFAPGEREALRSSAAPGRLRWQFWAAKEAAYKLAKKTDPGVIFSPSRFVVSLDGSGLGEVEHAGSGYLVRLVTRGDAVHAVATEWDASGRIVSGVASTEVPLDASREVSKLATRALAEGLNVPVEAIRIGRRGRIPTLEVRGRAGVDLSLSHHGRYVAFACDVGSAS